MQRIPRKQAHIISGVMFAVFFIIAFFYSLSKTRIEIEEQYNADVQDAYEKTIKSEVVDKYRSKGFKEGYKKAEPDAALVEKKKKIERQLVEVKEKALDEMQEYDRQKICQIAYHAGVARGETDARKNWSVEYWDEKTGVDIGKIISFGKKVVRLQLKYRNFPVGAPMEVDVEKDVEVDKSAVCGLLKGLQWANPATYQFFEGVKDEVCGSGRVERNKIGSKEKTNDKFWDSLPD